MVEVFEAESVVQFSSKYLGLDFGTVFRQSEAVFEQFGTKISRQFSDNPDLDYETDFWTIHVYSFMCIAKSE